MDGAKLGETLDQLLGGHGKRAEGVVADGPAPLDAGEITEDGQSVSDNRRVKRG